MTDNLALAIKVNKGYKVIRFTPDEGSEPEIWDDPALITIAGKNDSIFSIPEHAQYVPNKGGDNPVRGMHVLEELENFSEFDDRPCFHLKIGLGSKKQWKSKSNAELKYFTISRPTGEERYSRLGLKNIQILQKHQWIPLRVTLYHHAQKRGRKPAQEYVATFLAVLNYSSSTLNHLCIDLGSEATQMSSMQTGALASGEPPAMDPMNIIKAIEKAYGDQLEREEGSNPKYIQRDESNWNFYKTGQVLYRGKGGNFSDPFDEQSDSLLTLLCDANFSVKERRGKNLGIGPESQREKGELFIVQNLKLLYLISEIDTVNDALPDIEIGNRSIRNSRESRLRLITYLYEQLIHLACDRVHSEDSSHLFVQISFLAPNVYNQARVNELIKLLNRRFNRNFCRRYFKYGQDGSESSEIKKKPFVVIEPFFLSESDASLLGYIRDKTFRFERRYIDMEVGDTFLISDAGKGTFDYSILKYDGGDKYTCLDRGGMPGAGQYLSNIFIRSLARLIGNGDKDLNTLFYKWVTKMNIETALEANNFFDEIKVAYGQLSDSKVGSSLRVEKIVQKVKQAENDDGFNRRMEDLLDLEPSSVARFIRNHDNVFVDGEINDLADKFVDNLLESAGSILKKKDQRGGGYMRRIFGSKEEPVDVSDQKHLSGIKYLVFTGRTFLFDPLKVKMAMLLNERITYRNGEPPKLLDLGDSNDLKVGAILQKRFTQFAINENTNLIQVFSGSAFTEKELYEGTNVVSHKRFNFTLDRNARKLFFMGTQGNEKQLLNPFILLDHKNSALDGTIGDRRDFNQFLAGTLFSAGIPYLKGESGFVKDLNINEETPIKQWQNQPIDSEEPESDTEPDAQQENLQSSNDVNSSQAETDQSSDKSKQKPKDPEKESRQEPPSDDDKDSGVDYDIM